MPLISEYQPLRESGHLYSNLLGDICKQRREIYLHEPLANITHIYWEIIGKQRGEIYLHEHLANYTQIYWEIIGKERREFYLHEHLANYTKNLLHIKRREVDQNLLPIGGNYSGVGQWESKLFVRRMNFSSCRSTII